MNTFEISVKRFDEFASEYAEKFMNIDLYRVHLDRFCDLTENKQPKILELGCGPGNVTGYLKQRFQNSEIIAIDLAPQMIDLAKNAVNGVDFRVMDVREIKNLNIRFDLIMCSFCLPFLSKEDAFQLIADCSERLEQKGLLYLSTMEGNESKAGFEPTCFSGDSEVYFNYHEQQCLEKALLENGFTIEYNIRQSFLEPNDDITIDLMMIAKKK
ncbi:MAG: class I SAM-dependent methyltransferase [Bacteroidales bacterium]|jgi:2-polyprenyl-3-methyl-5-hydroxy-6-metoxy-1,4-benzoquinol methylase|nr:class I SAM-dependent methyltransferase [Bacteroidales bacterium]